MSNPGLPPDLPPFLTNYLAQPEGHEVHQHVPPVLPRKGPLSPAQLVSLAQELISESIARDEEARQMEILTSTSRDSEPLDISLDLSRKQVGEVPEEFIDVTKDMVHRLALSQNSLETLPARFSEYSVLRYLNIRRNNFTALPLSVCDITTLEILDVSRNQLIGLPPEIAKLHLLKVLAVHDNAIEELPLSIAEMDNLQILKLNGNPIIFPPPNILGPYGQKLMEVEELPMTLRIKKYFKGLRAQMAAQTDSGYETLRQSGTASDGDNGWKDAGSGHRQADEGDTATVYSDSSSLSPLDQDDYVRDLAIELLKHAAIDASDPESLKRVSSALPELLRAFALKLGYQASSQFQRDVMFFVHKRRKQIAAAFDKQRLLEEELDEAMSVKSEISSQDGMSPREKMSFWYSRFTDPDGEEPDAAPVIDQDDEDDEGEGETMVQQVYRDFLLGAPAYHWLQEMVRREVNLDFSRADAFHKVRNEIARALETPGTRKISRKSSPESCSARFHVEWQPLGFLEQQAYSETNVDAIQRAITLTGDVDDAQALTCRQYLCQTWPSTGELMLDILKAVVDRSKDGAYELESEVADFLRFSLQDGSQVRARRSSHSFILEMDGPADSIVEIGEQLAWLSAALCPVNHAAESGLFLVSPRVSTSLDISHASSKPLPVFTIQHAIQQSHARRLAPGQCWHNMFRRPVLVQGYPTRRKCQTSLGLEIPLNMMAGLVREDQAAEFDRSIFIKGFSAMLVSMKQMHDVILWHYLYNPEGERISYLDYEGNTESQVDIQMLGRARHVVGWCSDTKYYAGAADADFKIGGSGLPPPHPGCLLEKVVISGGQVITGGAQFAVGTRDIPLHITREGHIPRLKWLATKFVVFWDEAEKRGWLVNGTSALLHSVRASLELDREGDFAFLCAFDPNRMTEPSETHKPNSSFRVLTDAGNMNLEVFPGVVTSTHHERTIPRTGTSVEDVLREETTTYRVHHRFDEHYRNLEKMIEHQTRIAGRNGINMKVRIRKHLEGWDFIDVVEGRDLEPRVATLHALGYGWVDLIRTIKAPVLFGRGFGDMICATDNGTESCREWSRVPKGRYYLTTSVWDLARVIRLFGDIGAKPLKMCDELVWYCPDDLFEPCPCRQRSAKGFMKKAILSKHSDPAQILYPAKSRHLVLPSSTPNRFDSKTHEGGAVIWGHSIHSRFAYGETGDPEECDPTPLAEDSLEPGSAVDSGLGPSLSSSVAGGTSRSGASPPSGFRDALRSPSSVFRALETTLRGVGQRSESAEEASSLEDDGLSGGSSAGVSAGVSGQYHRNLRREKRRFG
ncbi:hypothetical protein B0T16DRAFT_493694 [Cercophora newfieldiana]|uniref:Uncharacterized protein n=1 Tax=Cercophora newfieldiana TaxID=92897 RepID=A0AA39Y953_9PEZI|nr:hypothetical protein B0T16DRAFT_493694 [Cercophora newfieldiana]